LPPRRSLHQHVVAAIKESPPLSVTMAEKVAELREWAQAGASGRLILRQIVRSPARRIR
jgi:hypothetical protein